jgi:hypothetical protein
MTPTALLAELRERGVELAVDGDKIRYRAPRGVLTADLKEAMRACKPDLLAALAQEPVSRSTADHTDPWVGWPPTLADLGSKSVGAFRPCCWCGKGTWVRYAGLPTCLDCTRCWPGSPTPKGARRRLWHLLDHWFALDEGAHTHEEVHAIKAAIDRILRTHPSAEQWYEAWRQAHPHISMGMIAR